MHVETEKKHTYRNGSKQECTTSIERFSLRFKTTINCIRALKNGDNIEKKKRPDSI